jgi:hypothetical protein
MYKWWFSFLLLIFWGCKEHKIDLSGEAPVKMNDFLSVFPKVSLPFTLADTNVHKLADTTNIGYKAFTQLFPDSALTGIIPSVRKSVIHPIGKFEKESENYLLILVTIGKKSSHLVVLVTDKKNNYLAAKELLNTATTDDYTHSVSINREPTFLISKEKYEKDNQLAFSRAGWVYTSGGYFMVVINDSNEDTRKDNIINPIDSLPRKFSYSGDYVQDKKNYISIRDGKKNNTYLFFIHFEKNEGTCTGELKGEMKMKSANVAQFTQNGDPCIIDFNFEDRSITLKEQGSCGNHRGIKCFFNDTFIKKREPKGSKKK